MNKGKQRAVRLDRVDDLRLQKVAKKLDVPVSQLIRYAIRKYLGDMKSISPDDVYRS